eukprot:CAMPEP_0119177962 /NCGR_PEP_ID=MMETSP1315-20130426/50277_1 /TAXON_ID=676789 /ORGANISM="Prasinoderma singularis, Strain RCC927" /LENGTH=53 /DNA_ID=CAMNT_0007172139 /DNA_START=52 /DNA_END=210 /DNA_ORIENTATION=-
MPGQAARDGRGMLRGGGGAMGIVGGGRRVRRRPLRPSTRAPHHPPTPAWGFLD